MLSRCYENLVRLVVATNLTYEGEAAAEDEHVDFKGNFLNLLQNEKGLYAIMCVLSVKMESLGMVELISSETEALIDAISFPTVPNNAARHSRDYHVLRLYETSADNMTSIFNHFAMNRTSEHWQNWNIFAAIKNHVYERLLLHYF